ncbi:hypothetical protein EWB00_006531, partial [Schistosoma japonicum]
MVTPLINNNLMMLMVRLSTRDRKIISSNCFILTSHLKIHLKKFLSEIIMDALKRDQ